MGSAQPGQSDVVDWRARKDWRGWMTNEREQREKAAARRRGERWGICTGRAQRVAEWLGSSLADKAAMNQTNKGHDHTVRYQPQGSLHLAPALLALLGKAGIALPSRMVMVSSVSYGIFPLELVPAFSRWMAGKLWGRRHTTRFFTHYYHKTNLPTPLLSLSPISQPVLGKLTLGWE
ncbi:hypothetical protein ASPBRDRAFT_289110 [Aspergillus brasiliensis CBS 101740]|uniref:Uncharacterized protein n=1 Tax=Aspergillus brasiliensis (strain CBS 101740 / IMI 381727 / IBT 21946) TaxID=767769 RepID=A0A1L9UBB3_ASPBC|nr:hypothetical protein ASPBRDRAFT_289110 [Aspergillus brasiliensis CBS 101740]